MFWRFLSRLPFHDFAHWRIRDTRVFYRQLIAKVRELPRVLYGRISSRSRDRLTVMYSRVPKSYVPTCILDTPTHRRMKRKKKISKAEIRKGRAPNSLAACVYSASFGSPYIQTYTTGYHIRTYTQPCWCWPTVWTYLSENLSRDPPGPCIADPWGSESIRKSAYLSF